MVVICPGFNLCLHPPPLPTSLGTYRQQKYVGFELGPLLWLWEEIERVCTASWMEMSALALLPRVESLVLGVTSILLLSRLPSGDPPSRVLLLCLLQAPQPLFSEISVFCFLYLESRYFSPS